MHFLVCGDLWYIEKVSSGSNFLIDRTNSYSIATTDPDTMTVYILDSLSGSMYARVLIHEIGHCVMFSCGLLEQLHSMVYPSMWIEAEEWVCNFLADYGMTAFIIASNLLGADAIRCVPDAMASLVGRYDGRDRQLL